MIRDDFETDIRAALEGEAAGYGPPADLAERIRAAASATDDMGLRQHVRSWRDARRLERREVAWPRWATVGTALAMAALFFTVGRVGTTWTPVTTGDRPLAIGPKATVPPAAPTPAAPAGGRGGNAGDAGRSTGGSGLAFTRGDGGSARGGSGGRGGSGTLPLANAAPQSAAPPEAPLALPETSDTGAAPKLAHSVALELRVPDGQFDRRWRAANDLATKHGGFVAGSAAEVVRDRFSRGTVTVRVPADQLDQALADFRRLGTLVSMNAAGRDVGDAVVDLDARLRNQQAEEARLLELLKEAKEDAMAGLRSRLDNARRSIEQVQGQQAALQRQVDLATIQVVVAEAAASPQSRSAYNERLPHAAAQAGDAMVTILSGAVVVAGYLSPFLLAGVVIWLIRRRRLRLA